MTMEENHTLNDVLSQVENEFGEEYSDFKKGIRIAIREGDFDLLRHIFNRLPNIINEIKLFEDFNVIQFAVVVGIPSVVEFLLGYQPILRIRKDSPLQLAAQYGKTEVALLLINAGADVNFIEECENLNMCVHALFSACEEGYLDMVRMLLQNGADPNSPVAGGETSLYRSVQESFLDITRELLNHGADPNLCIKMEEHRVSALSCAISNGDLKCTQLLLEFGADPSTCEDLLGDAIDENRPDLVKLLLEYGANPNNDKPYGFPLIRCVEQSDHESARLLMEYGADASVAVNSDCESPIRIAALRGDFRMVQLLLKYNMDLNGNLEPRTLLSRPLLTNAEQITRSLLVWGADVDCEDISTETAITEAVQFDRPNFVRLFLNHGCDPNATDEDSVTPLQHACRDASPEVVRLLLESNASIDQLSPIGNALHLALMRSNSENQKKIVQILLDHGVDTYLEREEEDMEQDETRITEAELMVRSHQKRLELAKADAETSSVQFR
eukprot:TRINITY_DN5213_c0_g3_i1.p1 TRINITY_DN5213_c0_g3~~TRINITY_DN5213_c0_g3_i1.p1  ORF type:complete len:509 (+),score=62.13 TRINITY_DN5213_c0_g3_i1:29-1528(+)